MDSEKIACFVKKIEKVNENKNLHCYATKVKDKMIPSEFIHSYRMFDHVDEKYVYLISSILEDHIVIIATSTNDLIPSSLSY